MRLLVFFYDYPLAENNHAGMPHFAKAMSGKLSCEVVLFKGIPRVNTGFFQHRRNPKEEFFNEIVRQLKPDDHLLFLEYLGTHEVTYQTELLNFIRQKGFQNFAATLLHLPFRTYLEYFTPEYIDHALAITDRIIVYGSSLAKDLQIWGVDNKVITTFHYVDIDFFAPSAEKEFDGEINVVIWGNTFRDISSLRFIVDACPELNFIFCIGKKPYHSLLTSKNVEVYEYIEEEELLHLLQRAHVNLSVMYDTIGSNVIVISKACGLVNVVSDVGSIRDYCSNNDSFLCSEPKEFVVALKRLYADRKILQRMAKASLQAARLYSLERSLHTFNKILFPSY